MFEQLEEYRDVSLLITRAAKRLIARCVRERDLYCCASFKPDKFIYVIILSRFTKRVWKRATTSRDTVARLLPGREARLLGAGCNQLHSTLHSCSSYGQETYCSRFSIKKGITNGGPINCWEN